MASLIESQDSAPDASAVPAPTTFTLVNHSFSFLASKKNNELLTKWCVQLVLAEKVGGEGGGMGKLVVCRLDTCTLSTIWCYDTRAKEFN